MQHLRAARLLVDKGLISSADLARALTNQSEWQSNLGEVLIGLGLVRPIEYYRAYAAVLGRRFVNLMDEPPDGDFLFHEDRDNYVRLSLIPWRYDGERCIIAAVEIGEAQRHWAEQRFGSRGYDFVLTSPLDIFWQVREVFQKTDDSRAREALFLWKSAHSARIVLTRRQGLILAALIAAFLTAFAFKPALVAIATMGAITVLYTVTFLFKFLLTFVGASRIVDLDTKAKRVVNLPDSELPVYTVLVPMFREARILPLLMSSLRKLDYPASKLEIKLVLEDDDVETIEAAKALRPPGTVEILRVPHSLPKTKPKACNYALFFARGEFITIYDAEDQPEPDQLKKAVRAFRVGGPKLACVQARLNYFNRSENWLTRMFTLEYSQWFDFLLPGLDHLGMPIPLGGTSNHFRLSVLRRVHAWDPFNVTEDADLGVRLAQEGYTIGTINSTTFEEANSVLGSWIRQRSRWIKGYMQTWLVHMRHPGSLWRTVGLNGFLGFHLFVGAPPFLMLVNPIVWTITIAFYLAHVTRFDWLFPEPIGTLATFNLFFANLFLVYFGIVAALKRRYLDLVPTGLMQPFYWLLHSIAAYRALWQLVRDPHYWEKTEHGTSRVTDAKLKAMAEKAP